MRKLRNVSLVIVTTVLFLGCDKIGSIIGSKPKVTSGQKKAVSAPLVKGTIVAKVNNTPIMLEDLNQEIDAYNNMVKDKPEAKISTRDQKLNYLKNEVVRRVLLYQEALSRGLDREDDVMQALEKTKQDLLVMAFVRQEAENIDVSSKEVEDYYNTYKEQLKEPESRQIREIVVLTEQEAKDILIQLLQGVDFASLAKERSKGDSGKVGGDLGFIQKGKKFTQFDDAAFVENLEVGKYSNIFKGPDGYYIIKLEARRGGNQKSLSDMWDDIKKGLTFLKQQKKIEDLIGKLSRESKLEFYEGEIK